MQPNEITILGITLPTVIVAALMGSALTLLGVFLQNIFENIRTNKKLKHEAKEKEIERKQNAKRQIYLEAVVEVAKAAKYLHKTFDLNMPPSELEALLDGYDDGSEYLNLLQASAVRHAPQISEFLSKLHPTRKEIKPSDSK
jgi:hypothetical protein